MISGDTNHQRRRRMSFQGLAAAVLAVHLLVIGFNLLGVIAIPLGAWRGWDWVRIGWWRWLHLASWAVVALQALAGRACVLTLWQDELEGDAPSAPLIARWVNGLIYYDLPLWAFAGAYLVLFAFVAALMWLVPARRPPTAMARRTSRRP